MTPLEQRYRSLLRRLPVSYRRQWEDDMVATFLAAMVPADPEEAEYIEHCGRPSREERASITRLAVRLRLGGAGDPPLARAWGDAVRRMALAGLLANSVVAFSGVWRSVWLNGVVPAPPLTPAAEQLSTPGQLGVGQAVLEVAGLLWVVAFVATLVGRRRAGAVAGVVACLPTAVGLVYAARFAVSVGWPASLLTHGGMALVTVAPLVALVAFHTHAPPPPPRPWLVALAGSIVVAAAPAYASLAPGPYVLDRPGFWSLAIIAAALVHLARTSRRGPADPSKDWTLALALLAGVVGTLRAVTLLDLALVTRPTETSALVVVATVQLLAVAAVGVVLWKRASRALRALPAPAGNVPPPPVLSS